MVALPALEVVAQCDGGMWVRQPARETPRLKVQPLWVRVDQNRFRLAAFVGLFVIGSALLLGLALVALPGSLLGIVFAEDPRAWYSGVALAFLATWGVLLAVGALLSAVQLANAEHWVRSRFSGRDLNRDAAEPLFSAIHDISLAAGLEHEPGVVEIEAPPGSVNAFALGTTRARPLIGVTRGFLNELSVDEQRAVISTLIARIVAGDIMFATALAALMGPLKAIRESRQAGSDAAGAVASAGCSDPGCSDGCADGCIDGLGDADGCAGAAGIVLFLVFVGVVTYVAVVASAWIVTLWGRALQRTNYEKADAEGMLLLKDPAPMLTALSSAIATSNAVSNGDASYDGIFYAATSGTAVVERVERRRYERLREVVGTEGLSRPLAE